LFFNEKVMERKPLEKFILISGSGQKVGKTYLATALIRHFSAREKVLALKISPHVHTDLGDSELICNEEGFRIYHDLEPHAKNSGQYLLAGASGSWFMETTDEFIDRALDWFTGHCNPAGDLVICESGALGRHFQPKRMIFIRNQDEPLTGLKKKSSDLADLVLPARVFDPLVVISRIDPFE
jgi:molybdopterin-guanine dinucleotide biosynthesis protein